MTKIIKLAVTIIFSTTISACAVLQTAPPSESSITASPFVVKVPKTLENNSGMFKGVSLGDFENRSRASSVHTFYSVNFIVDEPKSELETRACRGDYHPSTSTRYKSCVSYYSTVSVEELSDHYLIEISPYKRRAVQGKNALFLPIKLPMVDVPQLYKWMSNQYVEKKGYLQYRVGIERKLV
jgi:hypothetical protein